MPSKTYVGTAGWSLPRAAQRRFPRGESLLARYSRVFPAVEINSTFHRPHLPATFERWAASVPLEFRFSIKIPRTITHDLRLARSARHLDTFLAAITPLRARLGCLLVQLPPGLAYEPRVARTFLTVLRRRYELGIALEARHGSWFGSSADSLLTGFRVARVAADPPRFEDGGEPGGWRGLAYFRLHGSPRMYYSAYDDDYLQRLAEKLKALRRRRIPTWCIFDNTASGAAIGNALSVDDQLSV